jgi:dTDP-4-amino-4,6-dideoxy-D-galactose acyltransferase
VQSAAEAAACTLLPWDTDFWGVRIGRVEGDTMSGEQLRAVDAWAAEHEIDCLYFLAAVHDAPTAHVAEGGGFRLMDLRVELRRPAAGDDSLGDLREAGADDAPALRAIARASHGVTRFYADPNFPDERCDDFYDVWITRSLEGWAQGVLVADVDGRAAGYVSCHLDEGESRGSIGLIAVDGTVRRAGLGVSLSRGAVAWCRERGMGEMAVVTQGRNVAALRTLQRAGFLVDSVGLWFHKWYGR